MKLTLTNETQKSDCVCLLITATFFEMQFEDALRVDLISVVKF